VSTDVAHEEIAFRIAKTERIRGVLLFIFPFPWSESGQLALLLICTTENIPFTGRFWRWRHRIFILAVGASADTLEVVADVPREPVCARVPGIELLQESSE
jgi:hypothetical protein